MFYIYEKPLWPDKETITFTSAEFNVDGLYANNFWNPL